MNKNLPSEYFDNSYCIFVDRKAAREFNKVIVTKKYDQEGVAVLKGNFDEAPACIVIPSKSDFKVIEKELFALPSAKKGFSGQLGIGYKGKDWSKVE